MVHIDADLAPDVGSILTGAIHAWSEHLWRIEDSRTGGTDARVGNSREDPPWNGLTRLNHH